MTYKGDHSEPQEILRLLSQSPHFEVDSLNAQGWADYYYTGVECFCHGAFEYNTERKTWMDLAGGIEEVEEQLQRQLQLHPGVHHRLIIEGVAEPAAQGLLVYHKDGGRNNFRSDLRGHRGSTYKSITAWLRQVGKYWEIVQTSSMAATAVTIGTLYDADNEDEGEHGTFKRMFKRLDYSVNPQAQIILGASGKVKVGPKTAEAIAAKFGTPWRAFKAPVSEWVTIPGVGTTIATQYLRGLGRPDV